MTKYILLFISICLAITPIYLLIRRPWRIKERIARIRETLLGFFVIFMLGLFFMTFRAVYPPINVLKSNLYYRIHSGYCINMVPFKNIRSMYLFDDREHFIMNILGNTLMFIPWGFMRPLLWKRERRAGRIIAGAILLTCFIETVQLFTVNRNVDIDDIILNAVAGIFGGLMCLALTAVFPNLKKLAK